MTDEDLAAGETAANDILQSVIALQEAQEAVFPELIGNSMAISEKVCLLLAFECGVDLHDDAQAEVVAKVCAFFAFQEHVHGRDADQSLTMLMLAVYGHARNRATG